MASAVLKNNIHHFQRYFTYANQILEIEEESLKNVLIVDVINFLAHTYNTPTQLDHDILDSFIVYLETHGIRKSDLTAQLILSKVFENVLPDCYVGKRTTTVSTNLFLEFMIQGMLDHS